KQLRPPPPPAPPPPPSPYSYSCNFLLSSSSSSLVYCSNQNPPLSLYTSTNRAELLTTNKLSELACLTLYLMELDRQRGRGQLVVESPLLWSEDELAHLNGSPMKAAVLEREEGIKSIMSLTRSGLFQDRYFSNTRMIYLRRPFHMRFSSKLLLSFGYVSDPSEMESVISSQGPICPLTDSSLDPKKQVTTQLVKLEKKMLTACLHATAFGTLWRFESGHELGRWKAIEEYRLMHSNTTRLCMQSIPCVMAEMEKLCQNKRELSSFEVRCLFEKFAEMEKLCQNKRELSSFELNCVTCYLSFDITANDPRFERLPCTREGTYDNDWIVDRVT
ncbi:hypothetical protein C5167_002109, partial [Papaver somniferum]